MAPKMTESEFTDTMWNQYPSTLWKSDCILGDFVSLDQLRNRGFEDTQSKRDFFAEMLDPMKPEGNFLQI